MVISILIDKQKLSTKSDTSFLYWHQFLIGFCADTYVIFQSFLEIDEFLIHR